MFFMNYNRYNHMSAMRLSYYLKNNYKPTEKEINTNNFNLKNIYSHILDYYLIYEKNCFIFPSNDFIIGIIKIFILHNYGKEPLINMFYIE